MTTPVFTAPVPARRVKKFVCAECGATPNVPDSLARYGQFQLCEHCDTKRYQRAVELADRLNADLVLAYAYDTPESEAADARARALDRGAEAAKLMEDIRDRKGFAPMFPEGVNGRSREQVYRHLADAVSDYSLSLYDWG